jgi:hypothetical protein
VRQIGGLLIEMNEGSGVLKFESPSVICFDLIVLFV